MSSERTYDLGNGNLTNKDRFDNNIYWGLVVVDTTGDPFSANRIKVRIREFDKEIVNDEDLPWVLPQIPKFIHVYPQKGEAVLVQLRDKKSPTTGRFYIGPFISQPQKLNFDDYTFGAKSGTQFGVLQYIKNYKTDPDHKIDGTNWSILPDGKDIGFVGRGNQDIIFKESTDYDELILRVAKQNPKSFSKLNKKNPAYISLVRNSKESDERLNEDRTHVNVVADQINLISHKGSSKFGKITPILNSDDVTKQLDSEEKLHPLVYGDLFWEFVSIVREYVVGHIHPERVLPPDPSGPTLKLDTWINKNLGSSSKDSPLLSKGVKTN
jgi:hypothetical protein